MNRRPLTKSQAASLRARIEAQTFPLVAAANLRDGAAAWARLHGIDPERSTGPTPLRDRLPRADEPLTAEERAALPF